MRRKPGDGKVVHGKGSDVDQGVAGLIGAAIGAGGAIVGQVVTTVATGKTNAKRFAWEQAQTVRRERAEGAARFAETKRELYAAFLARHATFREEVLLPYEPKKQGLPSDLQGSAGDLANAWMAFSKDGRRMQEEITLVAPALAGDSHRLMVASAHAFTRSFGGEDKAARLHEYDNAIVACRRAMAAELNGQPLSTYGSGA
ncbi:hypothetical protein [Nocardioides sp. NPDC047086]|uniref:hypothetical protein n=1 Tax=Nocardioides sp. NPDC047086 TaxID=3154810 RepID=UPI00340391AE